MDKKDLYYTFIDELFDGVNKFIPIESMHLSLIKDSQIDLLAIEPKTHHEKTILLNGPSITKTSLESSLPIIENNLADSFLYNLSVDNPFQYDIDALAVIPIIMDENKSICGTLSLFRNNDKSSKNYFTKKSISKISKLLKKRIEKTQ
jgi:hypothetical protein